MVNEKIRLKRINDIHIHTGLCMYERGNLTYEQALEEMVIALLSETKDELQNELIKMYQKHGNL